jgi:AraC-like DNA-binding protein
MRASRSDIPISRAAPLNAFRRWLGDEGVPHAKELEAARLPRTLLPSSAILPACSIMEFAASVARREGIEDLGLRAALHPASPSSGPSPHLLRLAACPNGFVLLDAMCELIKVYSSHVPVWVHHTSSEVWLCLRGSTPPHESGAVQAEQFRVVSFVEILRRLLGGSWRPRAVHLECAEPVPASLAAFLGASVIRTGMDHEAVAISRARLEQPLTPSRLAKGVEKDPDEPEVVLTELGDWTARLAAVLVPGPRDGRPPLAYAADVLGLGPRTLQRRLKSVGSSVSDLLERARVAEAQRLLGDPQIPIREVAHRLGYSSPSSFARAYRRYRGQPPSADRPSVT